MNGIGSENLSFSKNKTARMAAALVVALVLALALMTLVVAALAGVAALADELAEADPAHPVKTPAVSAAHNMIDIPKCFIVPPKYRLPVVPT